MAKHIILSLILVATQLFAYDNQADNPYSTTPKPLDLPFNEPAEPWLYYSFWTLQVADIYSTYRGLKYKCVRELNPLLGEVPTVPQMVALKGMVHAPIYLLRNEPIYTNRDFVFANILSLAVLDNNYQVWRNVHKTCQKR